MSIESHFQAIAAKRSQLKNRIAEEMCHPLPDFAVITELKKQNMKLKEEMMLLSIESKQAASAG